MSTAENNGLVPPLLRKTVKSRRNIENSGFRKPLQKIPKSNGNRANYTSIDSGRNDLLNGVKYIPLSHTCKKLWTDEKRVVINLDLKSDFAKKRYH